MRAHMGTEIIAITRSTSDQPEKISIGDRGDMLEWLITHHRAKTSVAYW